MSRAQSSASFKESNVDTACDLDKKTTHQDICDSETDRQQTRNCAHLQLELCPLFPRKTKILHLKPTISSELFSPSLARITSAEKEGGEYAPILELREHQNSKTLANFYLWM